MPKVLEYTPSWLCRSSEGYNLFSGNDAAQSRGSNKGSRIPQSSASDGQEYLGATKTIARRGTEVFVVVENRIRWSDLCMLQETFREGGSGSVVSNVSHKVAVSGNVQDSDLIHHRVSSSR